MSRKIPLEKVLAAYKQASLDFTVKTTDREIKVKFSLNAFLYKQQSIIALWTELNRLNFRPVAKTFLGRICYIKIEVQ